MIKMKKLYPLLSVLFLIYWGCDDLFDPSVNLWGVDYSIENTTELYLLNSGLTGDIPSEIGNLTNLTFLDLHNNQLIGTIPPEIGNLTNLTYLYLSSNQLTGEIPPEIGNLTNLTFLGLSYNQLSGIIPDEICNQGDSSPNLSNNQLCPPYPSCIVEDYVGEQDTSDCVELWGEYYSIENTTRLDLSNSGLTGSIPPEIGNLTNLTHLNIRYNQLNGEIPESICDLNINWSSSWSFTIYNNQLCPPYPSCIEVYVSKQDTSDCP